ncbi:MAG: hypothetical protein ABIB47_04605 [Candidatus Woesearchaeota archaeon]
MPEYFVIGNKKFFGEEIRKKGEVDLKRLYKETIPWFSENYYVFTEKNISNKDTPSGSEQKLEWTAYRKLDSYFKFQIVVEIVVLRWLKKRAEITMRFKGYVETNYKKRYKGKFGEFMMKVYEDLLIKDKITKMKGKCWAETFTLIDRAKSVLDLIVKQ